MDWPKITVVVPSYNQAEYLGETLESIFTQHYPNLEVIVMDGGSTDGSVEIVRRYADRLAHWQSEPDGGQSNAVRAGFQRATGEVLGFLNSDDVYLPGALYAVAEAFRRPGVRWATGECFRFAADGPGSTMRVQIPEHVANWVAICPIFQPSTFVRRAALEAVGGYPAECRYSHDWHCWLELLFAGERPAFIPRYLSGFRVHGESATVAMQERIQREDAMLRDRFSARLVGRERARYRAYRLLFQGRDRMARGEKAAGRRDLVRGLMVAPEILRTRFGGSCVMHILRGGGRTEA